MIPPTTPATRAPADHVRFVVGLAVALCCALAIIAVRGKLLGDPDIWWHIATGSWIWQHGALPGVDVFSHSFAGQPWIAKEWLSQIIFAGAFAAGGWNAVALLSVAAVVLSAVLLYVFTSAWLRPSIAASLVLVCVLLASANITARPHVLSMPLLVIWTAQLFAASRAGRSPSFLLLILLVVWASLHAAFTMGFVIAFFAFLDFLEGGGLAKRSALARWLVFLALCPLVTLIHPYSYQAMLATWSFIKPHDWVAPITEWQPFDAQRHTLHALALIGLALAAVMSGFRLGVARALLLGLLTYLFLTHVRYAFFLFPVLALVIAPDIASQFPRLSFANWRDAPRDGVELGISRLFKPLAAVFAAVLALAAFLQLFVLRTAPPEEVAATAAIDYVQSHGITGNVMNFYGFGGPLIFNGIPTFIDGRTDQLFRDDFMRTFATGPRDAATLHEALDRYDIRWTIMPPGDLRVALLDSLPGWQRVYADGAAVIHQRRASP